MVHGGGDVGAKAGAGRGLVILAAAVAVQVPRGAVAGKPLFADSKVVEELSIDKFKSRVHGTNDTFVIDFYADWCPHCKHFAPIWENVAGKFHGESRARFGAVDCARYPEFCGKMGIGSYPTMRSFNLPGAPESFEGNGVLLHQGEYQVDQEADLVTLLRDKLKGVPKAIPPPPQHPPKGPGNSAPSKPAPPPPKPKPETTPYPKPEEPMPSPASARLRLIDAEVAIAYSLRQGTALAAAQTFKHHVKTQDLELAGPKLVELVRWLDFLSHTLPSARTRKTMWELANLARRAKDGRGHLPRSEWIHALDSRSIGSAPPDAGVDPSKYWKYCSTYTCGLWSLFHVLSVSAAHQMGARRLQTFHGKGQVPEVLHRIRGFVANFFGCAVCAKHFLATYDSCQFGICHLAANDGRGAALWLWQVHNNVTVRVASEQGWPRPEEWPPRLLCKACWKGPAGPEEEWQQDPVYYYLARSYTPPADDDPHLADVQHVQKLWRQRVHTIWDQNRGLITTTFVFFGLLMGFVFWCNSWRSRPSMHYFGPPGEESGHVDSRDLRANAPLVKVVPL